MRTFLPGCRRCSPACPPLPAARADDPVLVRQHGHRPRHPRPGPAAFARFLALGNRSRAGTAARPAAPARAVATAARSTGWPCVLGLLGVGGYNTLAYIGLQYTPATNAVLLNSFIPIATITLSWIFLGKHLHGVEWLGVLLSFVGVRPSSAAVTSNTLAQLSLNVGDLWMLAAVFTWALYTIGLQWRPAGVNPMLLLAAFTLVGLLALAPATPGRSRRARRSRCRRFAGRHCLHRDLSRFSRLRLLQPRRRRSRRQQGQPVHSPDAGLRNPPLGHLPRRDPAACTTTLGIGLIFAGIYLTTAALPRGKPA
jgi:hypothetical protein